MTVPFKGELSEYPVAKIFVELNKKRETGILSVSTPRFTKKVYFQNGDAIFAGSSLEDDRLGEMLLKWGKINLEQYHKSVELLKKTGKRQGQILVELGYLTPKELYHSVKTQVKEIIYSLFGLDHGEYEFIPGPLPTEEVITLRMSIGNLIYEGIKRSSNWSILKKQIPDNLIPRLSSNPLSLFQEIEFSEMDKKILTLIDGKKTVKQIIDSSWMSPFDALKTLYTLYILEVIEEVKPAVEEELVTLSLDEIFKPVVVEEKEFIKRVNEIYEKLGYINYFELFGISDDAGIKTITKRYFELTKEFHPDKSYNYSDPSLKEKLSAIVNALTEAYNILKDPSKRQQYINKLTGKEIGEPERPGVDEKLKKAISFIKLNRYAEAIPLLREYIKVDTSSPEAKNYLALAYLKTGDLSLAEKTMKEAIKLRPTSEYYTNLGLIYTKMGTPEDAAKAFQKAIDLNPKNEKARQYLERLKKAR